MKIFSKYNAGSDLQDFEVGFNAIQRKFFNVALREGLRAEVYLPSSSISASEIHMSVDLLKKNSTATVKLDGDELNEHFLGVFKEQVFQVNQSFVMDFDGQKLDLQITGIKHANVGGGVSKEEEHGLVVPTITCGG